MGLDMYAWSITDPNRTFPETDPVFHEPTSGEDVPGLNRQEFFYWRKHPNLHGWFKQLYVAKGGEDPHFNCNKVEITLEDLDALEAVLTKLPGTSGFFFGTSTPEDDKRTSDFIILAREFLINNPTSRLYYDSWW